MNTAQKNRHPQGVPAGGQFAPVIHSLSPAVALYGNQAYPPVVEIGEVYSGHALDMEENFPGITVSIEDGTEDDAVTADIKVPAFGGREAFEERVSVSAHTPNDQLADEIWENSSLDTWLDSAPSE